MVTPTLIQALGWWPSVLLLILLLAFTFFLLAIVCDEALAPTLEELSDAWEIPHDVACATFLAAGSSAPEIAISLVSVLHGKQNSVDISLGTLMGSALIAFTIIPAACVIVSPQRQLKLDLVPLARDVGFFSAGLLWVIISANDSKIDTTESSVLVAMFFVYLLAMKLLAPFYRHEDDEHHYLTSEAPTNGIPTNGKTNGTYGTLDEEQIKKSELEGEPEPSGSSQSPARSYVRALVPPFNFDESAVRSQYAYILFISIFYISILSEMVLYFAETLSLLLEVDQHFTGLVVVAMGAQVPDTVSSMAVAKHGEGPSSIANAIGSQVLNICVGIGLPFLLSNLLRGHPVELLPSSNSGHLIFGTVLTFLMLVVVERVTLKTRDAILLFALYVGVIAVSGATSFSLQPTST